MSQSACASRELRKDESGAGGDGEFGQKYDPVAMAGVGGFERRVFGRSLFEGVAQLCGAATLPKHRRHGVQSALLAARLEIASRAGCDVAVVTTQPGSKSQENVQKQGFELLYTRAILVRQP